MVLTLEQKKGTNWFCQFMPLIHAHPYHGKGGADLLNYRLLIGNKVHTDRVVSQADHTARLRERESS